MQRFKLNRTVIPNYCIAYLSHGSMFGKTNGGMNTNSEVPNNTLGFYKRLGKVFSPFKK